MTAAADSNATSPSCRLGTTTNRGLRRSSNAAVDFFAQDGCPIGFPRSDVGTTRHTLTMPLSRLSGVTAIVPVEGELVPSSLLLHLPFIFGELRRCKMNYPESACTCPCISHPGVWVCIMHGAINTDSSAPGPPELRNSVASFYLSTRSVCWE